MTYNFERIIRTSDPVTEPITLAEAKQQLRYDGTIEDAYITSIISVARDYVENFCNRYWASANATLVFDTFPAGTIPFNAFMPDITAINSIDYRDPDNALQSISGGLSFDADLREIYNTADWPTDAVNVKINLTMGPDAGASPVEVIPHAIRQAILLAITDLYNNRCTITTLQTYQNDVLNDLAYPYRTNLGI